MSNINTENKKAAFLVENGFCEREYTQAQKSLEVIGINCRLVSGNDSLIKGWNEIDMPAKSSWGADYAPDVLLESALPSDYDLIVIIGGVRSIEKLKLNNNSKAFVSAFVQTGKPVIAYNDGVELLSYFDLVRGYSLAATDTVCDVAKNNGGSCAAPEFVVSKNLITMSRFREVSEKISSAVQCILNGERYIDKIVSSDNMPNAHKAA